jgi:hypothetical protein
MWTPRSDITYYPPALRGWSPVWSFIGKQHMDSEKWAFGLTMMIVGMGGTFLTLWVLSLVMDLLKKIFPLPHKASSSQKQS